MDMLCCLINHLLVSLRIVYASFQTLVWLAPLLAGIIVISIVQCFIHYRILKGFASMKFNPILAFGTLSCFAIAQSIGSVASQNLSGVNVRRDSGVTGPPVEEVHYYYDQWPIGLAVSKQGRIFVCYTRGKYVSESHLPVICFQ